VTSQPVLSEKHHSRIIADKDNLCRIANIPVSWLDRTARSVCADGELDWLVRYPFYKRQGKGLLLTGKHTPPPETKMMAMVAALVRNYIDARLATIHDVIETVGKGTDEASVLFIPNLFQRQGPKGIHPYKMQMVYDLLLSRVVNGKVSVLYVEDLAKFGAEFGTVFQQHLEANYLISSG
jgi:hypothetical protein